VKLAGAILVAASFCVAGAAQAQQVELSTLRCRAFIDLPKETIANIAMWLDGYYTDEEDPAVIDFDKMKIKAEKLVAYCAQNPRVRVMTAAEDVIVK
jgi:acid stress chaperone HdeB